MNNKLPGQIVHEWKIEQDEIDDKLQEEIVLEVKREKVYLELMGKRKYNSPFNRR